MEDVELVSARLEVGTDVVISRPQFSPGSGGRNLGNNKWSICPTGFPLGHSKQIIHHVLLHPLSLFLAVSQDTLSVLSVVASWRLTTAELLVRGLDRIPAPQLRLPSSASFSLSLPCLLQSDTTTSIHSPLLCRENLLPLLSSLKPNCDTVLRVPAVRRRKLPLSIAWTINTLTTYPPD